MNDLTKLIEWVKSGQGMRTIEVKIGERNNSSFINIWAYDFELQEGKFVKSDEEINLKEKKEDSERKLYKKLKQKFEGSTYEG